MSSNPRIAAGLEAERQMVHYLRREFTDNDPVRIIHDLRILDPTLTEADGTPAVAQIDHLVIHKFGAFIVESKSAVGGVQVEDDGTGGDVWRRKLSRGWEGMPSPIRQAGRQADVLRRLLQFHRSELRAKRTGMSKFAAKLLTGTDQRGFAEMPIQIIVALSDRSDFKALRKWAAPTQPFQVFVTKADLVAAKIKDELNRHEGAARLIGAKPDGVYGNWRMDLGEVIAVNEFLDSQNTPRAASPAVAAPPPAKPARPKPEPKPEPKPKPARKQARPPAAACQACGSARLNAQSGPYGYYWKCADCSKNTPMAKACPACKAGSDRGRTVRVTKDGPTYTRTCSACGHAAVVWDAARDAG